MQMSKAVSVLIALSFVATIYGLWSMQPNLILNCDVDWLLTAAKRLWLGGNYSTHFYETNPPLILFLYMPVLFLSHLTSISVIVMARVYVAGLAFGSFCLCYPLIKKIFHSQPILIFLLTSALLIDFFILPCGEFGEREHIIVLFSVPYMLSVVCRLENIVLLRWQSVAVGILASIAFLLKPFYLLAFLMIEIYSFMRLKKASWLRSETIILALIATVYGVLMLTYFQDYLYVMIPFVARYYYQGYSFTLVTMLNTNFGIYFFLALALLWYQRKDAPCPSFLAVFSLASVCFYFCYVFQFSPLYYKLLPSFSIWFLLLITLVYQMANAAFLNKLSLRFAVSVGLLLALFLMIWSHSIWTLVVLDKAALFSYVGGIMAMVGLFAITYHYLTIWRLLLSLMIALGAGFTAAVLLTGTDWNVHHFLLTMVLMTLLFALISLKDMPHPKQIFLAYFLALELLALPAYTLLTTYYYDLASGKLHNDIRRSVARQGGVKSLLFLSSQMYTYPLVDELQVESASRFPFFWMLPGMVKLEKNPLHQPSVRADKALIMQMLSADIAKNKPDIILVDLINRLIATKPFSYQQYFFQDPLMQVFVNNYHFSYTIEDGDHYKFDVYCRNKDAL